MRCIGDVRTTSHREKRTRLTNTFREQRKARSSAGVDGRFWCTAAAMASTPATLEIAPRYDNINALYAHSHALLTRAQNRRILFPLRISRRAQIRSSAKDTNGSNCFGRSNATVRSVGTIVSSTICKNTRKYCSNRSEARGLNQHRTRLASGALGNVNSAPHTRQ